VSVEEDRASDRRIMVAFGLMLLVEVTLAVLADAGAYNLEVWLALSIGAVLFGGLAWAVVAARTEGTPVIGRRVRPPKE